MADMETLSKARATWQDSSMHVAKLLISLGLILVFVGLVIWGISSLFPGGKVPGDIAVERENFRFYFPLGTCILISVILSVISWFFSSRS